MSSNVFRTLGLAAAALLLPVACAQAQSAALWQEATTTQSAVASTLRVFEVDTVALRTQLQAQQRGGGDVRIELPLAHGGFTRFTVEDAGTLDPALAAQFPELLSLRGEDAMGRHVRLDVSPQGVNAMIFGDDGVQVIRPRINGASTHESFARADYTGVRDPMRCGVDGSAIDTSLAKISGEANIHAKVTSGDVRRNYRLALAGTGEYATAVCAPNPAAVACSLAAMTTSINRVNQVYETDVSVHMTLVGNNNLLVFTNGATDPFTDNDPDALIDQSQTVIDNVIGNANYDIGHTFSTGGGGLAQLGVTCSSGAKALGVTGRGSPLGDPFDIDYVAHEIGHQFGGSHTFNGTTSSCGGGNRSASSAYEPGSGSTIMAYAGICGAQDLQPNSDPYFHARSVQQIQAQIAADTCDVETPADNAAPSIVAMPARTIPARTPFALETTAQDANGDVLTYTWEQYDASGTAQSTPNPNPASTNGPLVRSFNPTPDPERIVPRLATLLGAPAAIGEVLPTASRTMNFRLTVRDNHPGGGATQSSDTALTVFNTGAAFAITAPNTGSTTWTCGNDVAVTWNVSGTTAAPISCAAVDLTLSHDGGVTFDTVLASAVPNTGTATVRVPFEPGTDTRIRARCANNIFFDINDADFAVLDAGAPDAENDLIDDSNEDAVRTIAPGDLTGNDTLGGGIDITAVGAAFGGTASIVGGAVRFTPSADLSGPAGFTYTLADRCARASTPTLATASVAFDVLPVNDAPVLALGDDIAVPADVGATGTVTQFASVTDFGAPDEATQAVLGYATSIVDDPAGVLSQVAIDPAGTLTYTLSGAAGDATVGVTAQDDGGTARGGDDTSAPRTFIIRGLPDPDVRVTKTNDADRVVAGNDVTYTIVVANVGVTGVEGLRLQDVLPAALIDATWTCSAFGTTCPASSGSGDVDLLLDLPIDASVTVTLTATVEGTPEGTVANTATATMPDGVTDETPADNTATDLDDIVGTAVFSDGFEAAPVD